MSVSKRRGRSRPFRQRGLVITEGTNTEPQYFDLLKQEFDREAGSVFVKAVGVGKDPLKLLAKAKQLKADARQKGTPYDWCCCVVDVDQHETLKPCLEQAPRSGIHVVVSNVKFEVWLLWHVLDKTGSMTGHDLDELCKKHKLLDGKNIANDFPVRNFEQAIITARRLDPELRDCRKGVNPSSSMPLLIDLMRGIR